MLARRWLLVERVGRGAFGDIFIADCAAADPALMGRRIALKVEKLELADEATVRAALEADRKQKEREAERLAGAAGLTAAAAAADTGDAALAVPRSPAPSSAAPLTPVTVAQPQSSTLTLPSRSPALPSEPLTPLTPVPPGSPLPSGGAAPVYMKRCIVKLEAAVLSRLQHAACVPRFVEYGRDSAHQVAYLGMELLGDNLLRLRRQQKRLRFSLGTALRFGLQALHSLETMHEVGFIHRDVKPSNFVIGRGANTGRVYLIDFGLARAYRDKASDAVIPPRHDIGGFRGTPRYASVYVHRELDLGRRDDVLSLLYILVEFVTGDLPWGSKRDKAAIGRIKERYHGPKLLKGCPSCFLPFFRHLLSLQFEDRPDYALLRGLLQAKLDKLKLPPDAPYDWETDASHKPAAPAVQQQAAPLHTALPTPPPASHAAGKWKDEEKEAAADAAKIRIVLHHATPQGSADSVQPSQLSAAGARVTVAAAAAACAAAAEEEKEVAEPLSAAIGGEDESSVVLQQLSAGLGGRQVSASISLSYSPSSYSQQPLSSRYDRAQSVSPALSHYSALHRQSTSSASRLAHDSPVFHGSPAAYGGEDEPEADDAPLVAAFEQGYGLRQLRSLDENQLNLRRKQRTALAAIGSSAADDPQDDCAAPTAPTQAADQPPVSLQ